MDQKTNLLVLKTAINASPSHFASNPIIVIQKILPDLAEEIIVSSLYDLKSKGLVNLNHGDDTILDLQILPSAIGYLRELEEAETHRLESLKAKNTEKWAERMWSLFMFGLGIISTIFAMWIKSTFFP